MTSSADGAALRNWLVDYVAAASGEDRREIDVDAPLSSLGLGSRGRGGTDPPTVPAAGLPRLAGDFSGRTRRSTPWANNLLRPDAEPDQVRVCGVGGGSPGEPVA